MEIDDKGGEIIQRYESFDFRLYKDMKALGEIETKKQRSDMDMDKEGATLRN